MKYLYVFLIYIIGSASTCTPNNDIIGRWLCDATGTFTGQDQGQDRTIPISEFYEMFQIHPGKYQFNSDGTCKFTVSKRDGTFQEHIMQYQRNYQDNDNKILITNPAKERDTIIMTINELTTNRMTIRLDDLNDDFTLNLNLNKIE